MRVPTIIGLLLVGACSPLPGPRVAPPPSAPHASSIQDNPAVSSLSTALDRESASRGRAMAIVGCASCHAIDAAGDSPLAVAPPFRDIVRRRGSDDLAAAFEQGLVTTHPAMPPYVFGASQIHDLTAYLDTLRAPVGRPSAL